MNLTLMCSVILDTSLYSDESVNLIWTCPADVVCNQTDSVLHGYIYISSLTFSLLSQKDDGMYTCTANIIDGTVVGPTSSRDYTITVIGEYIVCSCSNQFVMHCCIIYRFIPMIVGLITAAK